MRVGGMNAYASELFHQRVHQLRGCQRRSQRRVCAYAQRSLEQRWVCECVGKHIEQGGSRRDILVAAVEYLLHVLREQLTNTKQTTQMK